MPEKPMFETELGHILSLQDAITKICYSLSVEPADVYRAIPDLLRLSEEKFAVGHLPPEFRTKEDYDECAMFTSTGINPLGIILKKTDTGLQAETFRNYWRRADEQ